MDSRRTAATVATPLVHRPALDAALQLVESVTSKAGLAAAAFERRGVVYVRVSPPSCPAAGTDIRLKPHGDHHCFISERGSDLGCQVASIVSQVAFWFGRKLRNAPHNR